MSDGRRTETYLLSWGSLCINAGCKSIIEMTLMMGKAQKQGCYRRSVAPKGSLSSIPGSGHGFPINISNYAYHESHTLAIIQNSF